MDLFAGIRTYIGGCFPGGVSADLNVEKFYLYRDWIKNGNGMKKYIGTLKYRKLMSHFNCSVPIESEIGTGVVFPHFSGIFISYRAKIGRNCVIYQQVTIGSNTLEGSKNIGAPSVGDNCFIGAGAKLIGNVTIGDNVRIGANCIVCEDIPDNATVVLEKPTVIHHRNARNNCFHKW